MANYDILIWWSGTKGQAEFMFLQANRQHGLLTTALRCTTLYGEGDNTTIPQIVGNAQAGRGRMQVGDGQNMFDYTYLGNAAYAHRLAAMKLIDIDVTASPPAEEKRVDGEVFIITNDEVCRALQTQAGW
jgi:sterol-4alpha-carboxylate 3-dehydrogenase (decarboxylating)